MTAVLVLVGCAVALICAASIWGYLKNRRQADAVQLLGSALLLVMVLTHVAEQFHLLVAMRWGSSDSPGHYLDLISAVGGFGLFCGGITMKLVRKSSRAGSRAI